MLQAGGHFAVPKSILQHHDGAVRQQRRPDLTERLAFRAAVVVNVADESLAVILLERRPLLLELCKPRHGASRFVNVLCVC